jgi:pheromone shutdown protein TraB
MRTTVTLDDDIAELLKKRARERDVPFKRVLNEAIRAGLASRAPAAKPYRMKPRKLGVRPGVDLTKALRLAAELEDAEVVRELEQGR